jgi:hypothetical protein
VTTVASTTSPYAPAPFFTVTGTIKNSDGSTITVGSDTWAITMTNPGCTFAGAYPVTGVVAGNGDFTVDLSVTDPTDELVWVGDAVVLAVTKNGTPFASLTFNATVTQVSAAEAPGLVIQASPEPVNTMPSPPATFRTVSPTPNRTPALIWDHVVDPDNASNPIDYAVEMATSHSGSGGEIVEGDTGYFRYTSVTHPEMFMYSTNAGVSWTAFPSGGLSTPAGNWVKFTVPVANQLTLSPPPWLYQIRVTDRGAL